MYEELASNFLFYLTLPTRTKRTLLLHALSLKVKVKEGHTPKERRLGAHLPFIGR